MNKILFDFKEFGEKSSDSECEGTRNNFADAWCEDNQARGNWCQKFKKWMGDSCAKTCCYVRSQENKKETPEKTSEGKHSFTLSCNVSIVFAKTFIEIYGILTQSHFSPK